MKILEDIYLVGSGANGLSLTNPYDCNIYLVDCSTELVLIDTGSGLEPHRIEEQIVSEGFHTADISTILITHAHPDHVAGAVYLKQLTNANIMLTAHESSMLSDQKKLDDDMAFFIECGFYPEGSKYTGIKADEILEDGKTLHIGNKEFQVVTTPGHTLGSVCFLYDLPGRKILFTGDTITFEGKINLLCVPDVDLLAYKQSIRRLHEMRIDILLPGHRQPILNSGHVHVEKAHSIFSKLSIPESIA